MKTESLVRIFAGVLVLVSLALAHFISPWWLFFTAFIGLNLIQSAFTGLCPAEIVFRKCLGREEETGVGCSRRP